MGVSASFSDPWVAVCVSTPRSSVGATISCTGGHNGAGHGWSLAGHVHTLFLYGCSVLGREAAADAAAVGASCNPRVFPVAAAPEEGGQNISIIGGVGGGECL